MKFASSRGQEKRRSFSRVVNRSISAKASRLKPMVGRRRGAGSPVREAALAAASRAASGAPLVFGRIGDSEASADAAE